MNHNITKEGIEVKAGQVWRDLDKRMKGRTVTVIFATAQMGGLTREQVEEWRNALCDYNRWTDEGISEIDQLCDLALRGIEVREFLEHWKADGHLQTFEDRERFRKDAASLLERFPPPPERP